ncbi:MAG TPA: hypothetical protein VMB18_02515 [Terriglobales bacterium]|nr:hypothetical protein [Terriglobales bacterium]
MRKRGKILRDVAAGSGLLMVDGQQYPFSIPEVWRSEVAPRSGMAVEVEFEQYGKIHAIYAVGELELAGKRALNQSPEATRGVGTNLETLKLAAVALLIIAWFFLNSVSIQSPLGRLDFTYWQVLAYLHSGSSLGTFPQGSSNPAGAGSYGLLALVAICGPLLGHFWKDRRAALGGVLPLLFMTAVGLMLRSNLEGSFADASGPLGPAVKPIRDEAMAAVSLGLGAYLSGLAILCLAVIAFKQIRGTKKPKAERKSAHRAAA